jgi:hypothetical protein
VPQSSRRGGGETAVASGRRKRYVPLQFTQLLLMQVCNAKMSSTNIVQNDYKYCVPYKKLFRG